MAVDARPVYQLVKRSTLKSIGAGQRISSGSERCEWPIWTPKWVTEGGACYLVISRDDIGTYSVAIWRDGIGPKVVVEVDCHPVVSSDVDAVASALCGPNGKGGSDVAGE